MTPIPRGLVVLSLAAGALIAGCEHERNPALEHRKLGNVLYERADFEAAAAEYERSLAADPKQEKLWDKLAFTYKKAGLTDKAAQTLKKTLPFKADDQARTQVYRNIAGMYLEKGDGKGAEQYFGEALTIDPKDEQSLTWLAEISSQLGGARNQTQPAIPARLTQAISLYDQVIAVNPGASMAYVNKRIALIKYMNGELQSKMYAEEEAKKYRRHKDIAVAANERAKAHADKAAELKLLVEETSKKLAEVNKASATTLPVSPAPPPVSGRK